MQATQASPIEQCLAVGQQAILYPESQRPGKQRMEATIRGWQRGAYILLEVRLPHERTLLFHEHSDCSLRFLKDGVAYAIESSLLSWQVSKREPQIRVSWPTTVRSAAIRRQERIDVAITCSVRYQDRVYAGTLRDLSSGGCGLVAECMATPASQLTISCCLPDGVRIEGLPVMVRAARPLSDGQTYLGCSFPRGTHPGKADIAFYVGTSVLRLRQHTAQMPQYLVIGRDSEVMGALRESLDPTQSLVVTAVSLLEALVHARLIVPSLILLEYDWGETSALDACRILRASLPHKEVPIVVFGPPQENADETTLRTRVTEAGGTEYYATLPDIQTLATLLRPAGREALAQ